MSGSHPSGAVDIPSFRVLIIHAFTPANLGDGAIVLGMVDEVKRVFGPRSQVIVAAGEAGLFASAYGLESVPNPVVRPTSRSRAYQVAWLLFYALPRMFALWAARLGGRPGLERLRSILGPRSALGAWVGNVLDADVVLACGGGYIADTYWKQFPLWDTEHSVVAAARVPLVFFSQSFGPCVTPYGRRFSRRLARQASLFIARDAHSGARIREFADNRLPCVVRPDVVLAGSSSVLCVQQERASVREGTLGVSLMRWDNFSPGVIDGHRMYVLGVCEAVRALVQQGDVRRILVFATNSPTPGNFMDDLTVGEELIDLLRRSGIAATAVPWTSDPLVFTRQVTECELVLATRAHAAALSLVAGVPVVGIAYEDKMNGMLASFGLGDFTCDIEHLGVLGDLLSEAWGKRAELRRMVANRGPSASSAARDAMVQVKRLLDDGGDEGAEYRLPLDDQIAVGDRDIAAGKSGGCEQEVGSCES